jgi:catechol 2,3-dioxygenase-like lactoylglutathione lyase family enzyme
MIGYVTVGTNDMNKAAAFYDALLGEVGAKRAMEDPGHLIGWGTGAGSPMLAIITPADGKKATVGNGVMVALDVGTPDAVKKVHAKAMKLGGKDEGQPGPRGTGGFHGGYFRDLDGNKLVAFCMAR